LALAGTCRAWICSLRAVSWLRPLNGSGKGRQREYGGRIKENLSTADNGRVSRSAQM
jgi:hypothetical protein